MDDMLFNSEENNKEKFADFFRTLCKEISKSPEFSQNKLKAALALQSGPKKYKLLLVFEEFACVGVFTSLEKKQAISQNQTLDLLEKLKHHKGGFSDLFDI